MPGHEDGGKPTCPRSLQIELPDVVLDEIVRRVLEELPTENGSSPSPYVTIPEAAEVLRARRHRVDDLLSKGVLSRVKDGSRTLIARAELEDYLAGRPTGRAAR